MNEAAFLKVFNNLEVEPLWENALAFVDSFCFYDEPPTVLEKLKHNQKFIILKASIFDAACILNKWTLANKIHRMHLQEENYLYSLLYGYANNNIALSDFILRLRPELFKPQGLSALEFMHIINVACRYSDAKTLSFTGRCLAKHKNRMLKAEDNDDDIIFE